MKKYLLLIMSVIFLLMSVEVFAWPSLSAQKVVYRGMLTGLRIVPVNGTAFIDNAGATIPTLADGLHQIEIYDASGKMLRGVLSAAGVGAIIDPFNASNCTNGNYNTFDGASPTGFHAVTDGSVNRYGGTADEIPLVAGQKIIVSFDLVTNRNVIVGAKYSLGGSGVSNQFNSTSTGHYDHVLTVTISATGVIQFTVGVGTNGEFTVSNLSVRAAYPSTAGAVIVSAKSGAIQNFGYKHASFTYTEASYYIIVRELR